ncbi:MAG: DUF58 domain-containing protein [Clostridia bacterium]|nr:DUF58 domain-containing protein [Clostridia bacterium]
MNVLVVLLCLGAVLFVYSFLLSVAFRKLTITRVFPKRAVFEGETGEMVEVVTNRSPLLIPWLRVESTLPGEMRFGSMENLRISGGRHHRSFFILYPYRRITRRHRVTFAGRGVFDVGSAAVTAGDLLGIIQKTGQLEKNTRVIVYPHLLKEDELPQPLVRMLGEYAMKRAVPDPFLFAGIRPYRTGDALRDIHWPASARMGTVQVKVREQTGTLRLMVVLCGDKSPDQWGSLSEAEYPMAEHGIRVAATLCVRALRSGMPAGFAVNLDDGSGQSVLLPPSSGAAFEETLLTAMAGIRLKRTVRFETFLGTLKGEAGTDILLLMPPSFAQPKEAIARLTAQGSQVQVFPLEVS